MSRRCGGPCWYCAAVVVGEVFSTVTGDVMDTAGVDGRYWYRGVRSPVRFDRAVRAAWERGHRVFVECSPHPVLVAAVEDVVSRCAGGSAGVVVPTLGRDNGGLDRFWRSAGQVFTAGAGVDWSTVSTGWGGGGGCRCRHMPFSGSGFGCRPCWGLAMVGCWGWVGLSMGCWGRWWIGLILVGWC